MKISPQHYSICDTKAICETIFQKFFTFIGSSGSLFIGSSSNDILNIVNIRNKQIREIIALRWSMKHSANFVATKPLAKSA